MNALLINVQIKCTAVVCALDMERHIQRSYAAVMDVQILLSKEECAESMAQRKNDAAVKDAQI